MGFRDFIDRKERERLEKKLLQAEKKQSQLEEKARIKAKKLEINQTLKDRIANAKKLNLSAKEKAILEKDLAEKKRKQEQFNKKVSKGFSAASKSVGKLLDNLDKFDKALDKKTSKSIKKSRKRSRKRG